MRKMTIASGLVGLGNTFAVSHMMAADGAPDASLLRDPAEKNAGAPPLPDGARRSVFVFTDGSALYAVTDGGQEGGVYGAVLGIERERDAVEDTGIAWGADSGDVKLSLFPPLGFIIAGGEYSPPDELAVKCGSRITEPALRRCIGLMSATLVSIIVDHGVIMDTLSLLARRRRSAPDGGGGMHDVVLTCRSAHCLMHELLERRAELEALDESHRTVLEWGQIETFAALYPRYLHDERSRHFSVTWREGCGMSIDQKTSGNSAFLTGIAAPGALDEDVWLELQSECPAADDLLSDVKLDLLHELARPAESAGKPFMFAQILRREVSRIGDWDEIAVLIPDFRHLLHELHVRRGELPQTLAKMRWGDLRDYLAGEGYPV